MDQKYKGFTPEKAVESKVIFENGILRNIVEESNKISIDLKFIETQQFKNIYNFDYQDKCNVTNIDDFKSNINSLIESNLSFPRKIKTKDNYFGKSYGNTSISTILSGNLDYYIAKMLGVNNMTDNFKFNVFDEDGKPQKITSTLFNKKEVESFIFSMTPVAAAIMQFVFGNPIFLIILLTNMRLTTAEMNIKMVDTIKIGHIRAMNELNIFYNICKESLKEKEEVERCENGPILKSYIKLLEIFFLIYEQEDGFFRIKNKRIIEKDQQKCDFITELIYKNISEDLKKVMSLKNIEAFLTFGIAAYSTRLDTSFKSTEEKEKCYDYLYKIRSTDEYKKLHDIAYYKIVYPSGRIEYINSFYINYKVNSNTQNINNFQKELYEVDIAFF